MTSPNPGSYNQGAVTVGSTATLIATVISDGGGVVVQNVVGGVTCYLGGANVTSSGATMGVSLAAGSTLAVPSTGSSGNSLYAITASSTTTVAVLFSSGA